MVIKIDWERLANWVEGDGWRTDDEIDKLDWQKIQKDMVEKKKWW